MQDVTNTASYASFDYPLNVSFFLESTKYLFILSRVLITLNTLNFFLGYDNIFVQYSKYRRIKWDYEPNI
jgi:GTP cyclohydrolase III